MAGRHERPRAALYLMATSTIRGLILVALVVLGVVALTKLFPENASLGVTPRPSGSTSVSGGGPTGTPTPTATPTRKPRKKGKVTVQVLNGTDKAFFATQVTDRLKKDGYKVTTPGDYRPKVANTIIYYQSDWLPEAQRLQKDRFTYAALKPAPPTLAANIDLQVILGQDAVG